MKKLQYVFFFVCLLMAVYSTLVGAYLSSFVMFLSCSWLFAGVAFVRRRFDYVLAIGLIMIVSLSLALVVVWLNGGSANGTMPLVSLALFPSLVGWLCLVFVVGHLGSLEAGTERSFEEALEDFMTDRSADPRGDAAHSR